MSSRCLEGHPVGTSMGSWRSTLVAGLTLWLWGRSDPNSVWLWMQDHLWESFVQLQGSSLTFMPMPEYNVNMDV